LVQKFCKYGYFFLYVFRATVCPSSGETTVFRLHLVLVTLYGWLSCMNPAYQTAIHHNYSFSLDGGHIIARNM
jgi:hypothetical protein